MPHLLADWLYASCDLIYSPWDVTKLEKWGASWSASYGYRRENYILAMERCLKYAKSFNNFLHRSFYPSTTVDLKLENGQPIEEKPLRKRRKCCMISSMKLLNELEYVIKQEEVKAFAPPPKISFSSSFGAD